MSRLGFAEAMKALRKRDKLSQAELAERLGYTQQSIGKWEAGRAYPDVATVLQLAKMFGVSTDYLFGNDSIKNLYWKDDKAGGWSAVISPAEAQLLSKFRLLNQNGQKRFLLLAKDFSEIPRYLSNTSAIPPK